MSTRQLISLLLTLILLGILPCIALADEEKLVGRPVVEAAAVSVLPQGGAVFRVAGRALSASLSNVTFAPEGAKLTFKPVPESLQAEISADVRDEGLRGLTFTADDVLPQFSLSLFAAKGASGSLAVSYTHLTLPTN